MRYVIYLLTACILFMNNAYAVSDEAYCEKFITNWRTVLTVKWRPEKSCLLMFAERLSDQKVIYGCWREVAGEIHIQTDNSKEILIGEWSRFTCKDPKEGKQ